MSKLKASWCENAKAWFALISAISGAFGFLVSTHVERLVNAERTVTLTAQNEVDIRDLKKGSDDIKIILVEHTQQLKSIPKMEKQLEKIVDRMSVLARQDERKRIVATNYTEAN